VFGRRKQEQTLEAARVEKVGGKNRPTPKRSEREALNKRPLVPSDRKAAAKAQREAVRAERLRAREAMMTGDERFLPERDKGPVRRYVRDFVDARYNAGEFFLVVALLVVFMTFLYDPTVQLIATAVLWLTVIASVLDGYILSRQLKKRLAAKFGAENVPAGSVRYGVLRAFQIRRTRLPKPMVKRGQYPS
jgi:hypothetical protein